MAARTSGLVNRSKGAAKQAVMIADSMQIGTKQLPVAFTFAPAVGTTNQTLVTIQAKDGQGNNIAGVFELSIWLSDAATGIGLTATTASGAVGAGASGTDLAAITAKKLLLSQTDVTGKYILAITDSAKTGFYVALGNPFTGTTAVSAQLVTGNYG